MNIEQARNTNGCVRENESPGIFELNFFQFSINQINSFLKNSQSQDPQKNVFFINVNNFRYSDTCDITD